MKFIPVRGGRFKMGDDRGEGFAKDLEGPKREVSVAGFSMTETAVTNRDFLVFFNDTGYITEAERYGYSFVFSALLSDEDKQHAAPIGEGQWWWRVEGANWRKPKGEGSSIEGLLDHPVVHVSYNDAMAFARWAGGRLPTEAEWEYAARAGTESRYPWGEELVPEGRHMANTFQGDFPDRLTAEDGFFETAPVKSFPANRWGFYEVSGNVYEWCLNDGGLSLEVFEKRDAADFLSEYDGHTGTMKALRGGSFLCSPDYCRRYRVASRNASSADSSACHIGFRVVRDYA